MYPRKKLSENFLRKPELIKTVWEMLNRMTPESLHSEGRVYGGGLQKIEPSELLNVEVPFFKDINVI
jgi:hypothetical protein